jgi:hypothetical protein
LSTLFILALFLLAVLRGLGLALCEGGLFRCVFVFGGGFLALALEAEGIEAVFERFAGFGAGAFAGEEDGRGFELGAEGDDVAGLEEVRFLGAFTGGFGLVAGWVGDG